MNLQNLMKVEKPQFYLDKAINQTDKLIRGVKSSSKFKGKKIERSKFIESKKISTMAGIMVGDLQQIERSFPTIDNLPLFYQELIDVVIGIVKLKKSLSSISWLGSKINELSKVYMKEIKRESEFKKINAPRKKFLGRVSSMFKKVSKDFSLLEDARKKLRNFPSVKTDMKTFCIAGFPNVGKSTLLSKLTTAKPEINVYPFTTKGLMFGYMGKIQLIDTPGAFREDVRKMNYIEKQAYLALKYLAEKIIFIFDISETCGYSAKDQKKLFSTLRRKFKEKEFMIFLSKKDLIEKEKIEKFRKEFENYSVFSDVKILKKFVKK